MAYETPGLVVTFVAGGDLSSQQYHFVKLNDEGEAVIVSADTDHPVGVLQNNPTEGQEASVMVYGLSKVRAGGTIDVSTNRNIGTAADGEAEARVVGTDTTKMVLGKVLGGTDVADQHVISALIDCIQTNKAT